MKSLAEKIAVMQAAEQGAQIEFASDPWDIWAPCQTPAWDWSRYNYRVATKPKKTVVLRRALCRDAAGNYWLTAYSVHDAASSSTFIRWHDSIEVEVE